MSAALRIAALMLALALGGQSAKAGDECSICDLPDKRPDVEKIGETVINTPALLAYESCRAAKTISCDGVGEGECWVNPVLGAVVTQAKQAATRLPKLLSCGTMAENCPGISPLIWIFLSAAALTLVVDAGRALVSHYSRWTDVMTRAMKIAIVTIVIVWAGTAKYSSREGLGPTMWQWTGNAVAMGGLIGRYIGIGIQENANPSGTKSSARCSSLVDSKTWAGPHSQSATTLESWKGVLRVSDVSISEAADMGAILTGVAITLVPNFTETAGAIAKTVGSIVTFDFRSMMEILRVMFAVTLAGTAITIILTVAFMILEAVVIAGITIGLLPIIACMWMWEQTKSASKQALAALMYAVMSLTVLGVTLEVTYLAVERTVSLFTSMTLDPHYPQANVVSALSACDIRIDAVEFPSDGTPQVNAQSMYEAYKVYLCLHEAPPAEVTITDLETSQGKKENQVPYEMSGEEENVYIVPASRVGGEIIGWLPAFIILVGAGVIANAVMRYASAGASELSGYRAPASQIASQVVGAGKSFATWGGGKMKGLLFK